MSVVTVTVLSEDQTMNPEYELMSVDVLKEVNRIPSAELVILDGDAATQQFLISDAEFFAPGKQVEIKIRYEADAANEATIFKGLVTRHSVEANARGSLLRIDLKDEAVKLTHRRNSAVYTDMTDDKVISEIIDRNGLTAGTIDSTDVKHRQLVQYYCTDWDFMLSRADSNNLLVQVDDGAISFIKIAIDASTSHTITYGIDEVYRFEIEADAEYQLDSVESIGWSMKDHALSKPGKAADFALKQGNLKSADLAKMMGSEEVVLMNPVALDAQELQAWSDATLARSRLALLRGSISVAGQADIKPMNLIVLDGIGERFNGETLITGVRHRVDSDGWQTDIQFGLSPERFAQNLSIMDIPAAGLLPAVLGLQVGIVAQFDDDPDKELRVQVQLPGLGDTEQLIWARLATPDAGNERGFFFFPEVGDEVVVGFFNNDPRQAVILGAMFGSKNTLPAAIAPPDADNLEKGIVTRQGTTIKFTDDEKAKVSIETPEANTILLDDDAQSITLTDQHGNSIVLGANGIEIKSAKDIILDASGNIEIKGQAVDVQ